VLPLRDIAFLILPFFFLFFFLLSQATHFPFTPIESLPQRGQYHSDKMDVWRKHHSIPVEALFNEQFLFNYVPQDDLTHG